MTPWERYFLMGRRAGCPKDQMDRFQLADVVLQARQLAASAAARLCDAADGPTAIGYGGARGGGKSHWLLAQMGVDDCQRVPGLKCLLLRKVGKANLEHFEDLRRKLFTNLGHEFSAFRGILTFNNGSRIIAGHFQNEKDIDAYLGLEYDVIGIEEATTLTARKYQDITTCCRTSKPNWRPRIYSTTNPGGVGHAWYRKTFIEPYRESLRKRVVLPAQPSPGLRPPSPVPTGEGQAERPWGETIFIPARVTDNRWNNPEYVRVLEGLGGWQRRAWLDGDWDLAAGQFFTTFRRDVHVLDSEPEGPTFDDLRGVEWFAAMDYGYAHYTVVLLGCKDGDGNMFIVDEHAARMWLPQRHAEAIKAMVGRHRINGVVAMRGQPRLSMRSDAEVQHRPLALSDMKRFVAGADVFSRQSDGTTIAQQYAKFGITLRCANTDRVHGWAEILTRLGEPQCGLPPGSATGSAEGNRHADAVRPTLFIHQRCARLIETLPTLQHDPNRPEDVLKVDADEDGVGGDDCADCLRYLVATKSRTIVERKLRGL